MASRTIQASDREWEVIRARARAAGMDVSPFIIACGMAEDAPEPETPEPEHPVFQADPLTPDEARHLYHLVLETAKAQRHLSAPMPHAKWYDAETEEEYALDLRGVLHALYLMKGAR